MNMHHCYRSRRTQDCIADCAIIIINWNVFETIFPSET